jgi:hypothetical protein
VTLETRTVRALVRVRFRMRVREWWRRRRLSPAQREMERRFSEYIERALLFGKEDT